MDCNTPGFPALHCLLESTQTFVHRVGDATQPSYPLSSPSPPAFRLSQHQGLFQWVSSLHQVAQGLECQSAILVPFDSNQFLLCPWTVSFFQKLCSVPFPFVTLARCHFSLVAFNILPVLIFVSLITVYLGVFLFWFILPGRLCFPDLVDYFFSHVREVFSYYLFKYFLRSFLSSLSGTPVMQMLVCLILSQMSLNLSSFLIILFSMFCSVAVISPILSSRSFICSYALVILLLIPSSVVFIFIIHLYLVLSFL